MARQDKLASLDEARDYLQQQYGAMLDALNRLRNVKPQQSIKQHKQLYKDTSHYNASMEQISALVEMLCPAKKSEQKAFSLTFSKFFAIVEKAAEYSKLDSIKNSHVQSFLMTLRSWIFQTLNRLIDLDYFSEIKGVKSLSRLLSTDLNAKALFDAADLNLSSESAVSDSDRASLISPEGSSAGSFHGDDVFDLLADSSTDDEALKKVFLEWGVASSGGADRASPVKQPVRTVIVGCNDDDEGDVFGDSAANESALSDDEIERLFAGTPDIFLGSVSSRSSEMVRRSSSESDLTQVGLFGSTKKLKPAAAFEQLHRRYSFSSSEG